MRKLLAILGVILLLVAGGALVLWSLAQRERRDAVIALGGESDEAFDARYPAVPTTNQSAEQLGAIAKPLGLDFNPLRTSAAARPDVDEDAGVAIARWLDIQRETADDSVTPMPAEASRWLATHEATIAATAQHLLTAEPPQWPVFIGEQLSAPSSLPNLHAQMRLMKILSAASLQAEAAGDHARAWQFQEATWKVARPLFGRPELISRLIGIAGFRLIAAGSRKLEPPAPAWLAELDALPIREAILDASRAEFRGLRDAVKGQSSWNDFVERTVTGWIGADLVGATASELRRLAHADPCAMDLSRSRERIQADLSFLARRMDFGTPSLITAMARAADTEIAIDGTMRVLDVKRALAAGMPVPQSTPSACKGAAWIFGPTADGASRLRFTGEVTVPPRTVNAPIPTEFVLR